MKVECLLVSILTSPISNFDNYHLYDSADVLNKALRFFPKSHSDHIDLLPARCTKLRQMNAAEVVIQSDERRIKNGESIYECFFSFDEKSHVRGVFGKCSIFFWTDKKIKSTIHFEYKKQLIDFIKSVTPEQLHYLIECDC